MAVFSACDAIDTASVEQQPVAEAYLEAGKDLPEVVLSRTAPIDAGPGGQQGIRDADVFIDRLGSDGSVVQTVPYRTTDTIGFYVPDSPAPTVQGGTTYRLRAELPEGGSIRAVTTVPTAIQLVASENTDATFQSPVQPSFTVTRAEVKDAPVVLLFTTTSQLDFEALSEDELIAEFTPFYADAYDPDEDDIEDFKVTQSPILNEANYDDNGDGTITIDFPWIAVAFFGGNEVAVSVLDRALYDYLRTQEAQQGGLSPGEIPNIVDNIEGGTGIFGSYARASASINVQRP
ncbi:DUF4249 family protein [Longibacter sp.]|uniref:DUF4249 family protein n=1 Tax=Longibacter sp. TaxID=2045415 RepID=UPI003EB866DD